MRHDLSVSVEPPTTLGEVVDRLKRDPRLIESKRRDMISAVQAVARFAGLPPSALAIDVPNLRKILDEVQPRRHRISARRLANIRSLFVQALVQVGAPVEPLRLGARLSEAWATLMNSLQASGDRNATTRFSQWCSINEIVPEAVTDAVIERYAGALENRSFVRNPGKHIQNLVRTWNRSRDQVAGWPAERLTQVRRREIFIMPEDVFPESFAHDLDRWCAHLSGADPLAEADFKPLREISVSSRRESILRCASALVHQGMDPSSITDLAVLVELDNAKAVLRWFLGRSGDKPSWQSHGIAGILLSIGRHWADLDDPQEKQLRAICRKCRIKSEGMTAKNRNTLRVFDDERLIDEFLSLPGRLMRRATAGPEISKRDAYLAAQAVAVAILTCAPVRIENLSNIEIDRHLIRSGKGRRAKISIAFAAHEVKNDQAIELPLSSEAVRLIDVYLAKAWPVLAAPGCRRLFPGRDGEKRSKIGLGMAIVKTTERELGVRVTPHQFRHLAGYLFLRACPGEFETVRLLLGHKSLQTTVQFYAGMETTAAAKRFEEVVLKARRSGGRR